MKFDNPNIKVTSRSFSRHPILRQEILDVFPNTTLNIDGPETGLKDLEGFLKDANGIILGMEQMDRPVMQNLKCLKIISKFGVGLNNLDLEAASKLGITLGWTGGINKRSVA